MDKLEARRRQVLWVALGPIPEVTLEPGSFYRALIEAAFKADRINLYKLKSAFPNTFQAVKEFKDGDLHSLFNLPENT